MEEMLIVRPSTLEERVAILKERNQLRQQVAQLKADRAALIDILAEFVNLVSGSCPKIGDVVILAKSSYERGGYWQVKDKDYFTAKEAIEAALQAGKE